MSENKDRNQASEEDLLASTSLGEDLSYLLAFNASILNLIPDGVASLDESLKIRTANTRFREIVTGDASGSYDNLSIADHPIFQSRLPRGNEEKTLLEVLHDLLQTSGKLDLSYMEVGGEHEYAGAYSVRATSWDTENDQSSRILLWIHPEIEEGKIESEEEPAKATDTSIASFSSDMLENIPIGVCELSPGLFLSKVNEATELIFGRSIEIKKAGEDHIFSLLPELCSDSLLEVLESSAPHKTARGECLLTRPNGDEVRLSVELHPSSTSETDGSTLLFLRPENADFLKRDLKRQVNEASETASTIDDLMSRHYPVPTEDLVTPVNAEVKNLLTALDLLLDFDALCERVLDMGLEMTGGVSGSLMLLNQEGRELSIMCARGLADPIARSARQRLGEGIAGSVAEKGEPLLLQGRIGDKRFRGVGGRPEVQSSVCVPVISEIKVLGVMNINSASDAPPFTDDQLRQVASMGRQIGGAIERSRQLQRMQRRSFELAVRAEIESIKFSTGSLGSKLGHVSQSISDMLGFDICAIYLKEKSRKSVTLRAVSGLKGEPAIGMAVPIGTGHVGWVARNMKPLVLRNISTSGSDQDEGPKMTVILPISGSEGLTGVLAVESTNRLELDNSDMELIGSVARAIGQMIGDVRSKESSARKMTMLSALGEMGVAFTAARDRAGLARLVAFCGGTVLESDIATVRVLSEEGDQNRCDLATLELLAAHGTAPPAAGDPLGQVDAILVEELIRRKQPLDGKSVKHSDLKRVMAEANVSDALAIPLLTGEEMFGSIVVYRAARGSGKREAYGEQELEIAMRLGDYAGAAASQFTYWSRSNAALAADRDRVKA